MGKGLAILGVPVMRGGSDSSASWFVMTVTTTGAQTLTLQDLTVSASTTVDWGDGSSNDYTGSGTRTHNYAGAGKGDIVTYSGRRYRCWQTHTSQVGWEPPKTPALWLDLGPI